MRRPQASIIPWLVFCSFCVLVVAATPSISSVSSPRPPSNSPPANTELLCHTDNPIDCYPRIFQPTDEFQVVHDDQELPTGLHVRLNIWTGLKEAKINVPDEKDSALDGLPIDSSVVLVDPDRAPEPLIPRGAPSYDTVGKIKPPRTESESFQESLTVLKNGPKKAKAATFDKALESLEEISHDIYYGLKITEDREAFRTLFCLMTDHDGPMYGDGAIPRNQQASSIISAALQNNPSALKAVEEAWPSLMATPCRKKGETLQRRFCASFMPEHAIDTKDLGRRASEVRAFVAALNGLIKSPTIRDEFISNGGMANVLEVLIPTEEDWALAQKKVGLFLLDNFLDGDMGATKGVFPRGDHLDDAKCREAESKTADGCVDYHVKLIMERNMQDRAHWSRDVHNRLSALRKDQRKTRDSSRPRKEL